MLMTAMTKARARAPGRKL